jgi:tetratricopeptide (TPR) repeat protein
VKAVAALLLLGVAAAAQSVPEAVPSELERLRALDPDDPDLLRRQGLEREQAGDADGAIADLLIALDGFEEYEVGDDKARKAIVKDVEKHIEALDPGSKKLRTITDSYLAELTDVLRLYARNQKKYRNALEVAGQILHYRPNHKTARTIVAEIDALGDKELSREAERLLSLRDLGRPRSFRLAWLEQHADWGRADSVETPRYIVTSDIGHEAMHRAAGTLEQVADFYERFYGASAPSGQGKTPVHLYRSRAEFEDHAGQAGENPDLKAYLGTTIHSLVDTTTGSTTLDELEFILHGYDLRDEGFPPEMLYEVLLHEASHQYMRFVSGLHDAPAWLDEGMACYFEGARVDGDGRVEIGRPAPRRLSVLHPMLARGDSRLVATVSAHGQLDTDQYSVAWGLMYFTYHYQGEDGSRPYRPAVQKALDLVRGSPQDPERLFRETILAASGLSLDAFERQWTTYIHELAMGVRDPEACARALVERGRSLAASGDKPAARETFEDALRWEPESIDALLGLAGLSGKVKDKSVMDQSLLWARQAWRLAGRAGVADAAERARTLADTVDPGGLERLIDAEDGYRESVQAEIARHLAQGRPQTALALARRDLDGVLGDDAFAGLARQLREQGTVEISRLRLPFDGSTLFGLVTSSPGFQVEDGMLACNVARPLRASVQMEDSISPRYRLEGEIEIATADTVVALYQAGSQGSGVTGFVLRLAAPPVAQPAVERPVVAGASATTEASGADGEPVEGDQGPPPRTRYVYPPFDLVPAGQVGRLSYGTNQKTRRTDFRIDELASAALPSPGTWIAFALDRSDPTRMRLELGGSPVAEQPVVGQGEVHPALLVFNGSARLRHLAIREFDRF